ncbi:MAG: putative bifunctional diguanylate cyclase/phosphodiesterase [Sphaerochaeta sp.]
MERQQQPTLDIQNFRRSSKIFRRVLILSVSLISILTLFFHQFSLRLEHSLWEEKQLQFQYLADQSSQLLTQQIGVDTQSLDSLIQQLELLEREDAMEMIASSGFLWEEEGTYPVIQRNGEIIEYAREAVMADGESLTLFTSVPIKTYEVLLGTLFSGKPFLGYWIHPEGTLIWQTDGGMDGLPSLDSTENESLQLFSSELGTGWGQFVLVAERGLSPSIALAILSSSLSMAVLVIVIFLVFLIYLLSMDHRNAKNLWHLAYEDELTKLPNKNLFVREAKNRVTHAHSPFAVMVLDIGKLKLINDHFGYGFGDTLLSYCASVLVRYVTSDGLCARLSGDKFILLVSYREKAALERRVATIRSELQQYPFPKASQFQMEILIGISLVESSDIEVNVLIDRALFALSALKEKREEGVLFYEEVLKDQLLEESELEHVFTQAIKSGQFFIQIQPKYSFSTQRLIGGEALVRWSHPAKGLLNPSQFIPLLEKHNLLIELDMYVLEQVCELFVRWKREGKALLPISVNQSRSHLFSSHYESSLVALVDRYEVDHHLMEFEMTETLFLHDLRHLASVLTSLRSQGFLVSLDDFGSGYSSLTMLKDVQVDVIKMDQGFFTDFTTNDQGRKVIKHIIGMAKDLGITTIAEGVENEEQARMLQEMGCDGVQGYFFSQPLEVSHYETLLDDDRPRCFL